MGRYYLVKKIEYVLTPELLKRDKRHIEGYVIEAIKKCKLKHKQNKSSVCML